MMRMGRIAQIHQRSLLLQRTIVISGHQSRQHQSSSATTSYVIGKNNIDPYSIEEVISPLLSSSSSRILFRAFGTTSSNNGDEDGTKDKSVDHLSPSASSSSSSSSSQQQQQQQQQEKENLSASSPARPVAFRSIKSSRRIEFVPLTNASETLDDDSNNSNSDDSDVDSDPNNNSSSLPDLSPPKLQRASTIWGQSLRPRASNPSKFKIVSSTDFGSNTSSSSSTTTTDNNSKTIRNTRRPEESDKQVQQKQQQQQQQQQKRHNPMAGPLFFTFPGIFLNDNNNDLSSMPNNRKSKRNTNRQQKSRLRKPITKLKKNRRKKTIAQQLIESGEKDIVPNSCYVFIDHITPVSSLETMIHGVNKILDREIIEHGGIIDIDAIWEPPTSSSTSASTSIVNDENNNNNLPPLLSLSSMFPQYETVIKGEKGVKNIKNITEEEEEEETDEEKVLPNDDEAVLFFPQNDLYRWIHEARVVLSAMGRPVGWKMKLANRSIVSALIRSANKKHNNRLMCAWKIVPVREWSKEAEEKITLQYSNSKNGDDNLPPRAEASFSKISENERIASMVPFGNNQKFYNEELDYETMDWLNDSVLRVENCDDKVNEQDLLHVFSRYDLQAPSIIRWIGHYTLAVHAPPQPIFFIRFVDASWARAAIREKQGTILCGKPIRLVQFPKQLIHNNNNQQQQQQHYLSGNDEESTGQQRIALG